MSHRYTRPAFMVAALIIAGVASAAQSNTLTKGDRAFIEKAAKGGVAEVELGNLAQQKAQNQQVKDFAARMVQDHSKANQELKLLAAEKNVTLPTDIPMEDQSALSHLKSLEGPEFDQAFKKHAIEDHEKEIQKFQTASQTAADLDVKAFALKMLPILQQHLKMAQDIPSEPASTGLPTSGTPTDAGTQGAPQSTPQP